MYPKRWFYDLEIGDGKTLRQNQNSLELRNKLAVTKLIINSK
jgi:hypothetical protein